MKKWIATLALTLASIAGLAQTNQGPFNTPRMNSTYYVGSLQGGVAQFYPTIQSAVTAACAAGTNNVVDIPPAYTGSDPISGVTGGCTSTTLRDEHNGLPVVCYTWQTSVYSSSGISCSGGGGGLSPDGVTIFNNSGVLSTKSIQIEEVFTGAGTQNFVHNLNDKYPLAFCYSKSGATAYTMAPVDANTMAITTSAAADILCSFAATLPEAMDFSFTVTPSTYTYVPTMGGTQTPTFAISQAAIGGYTGTATYSTSGLASGMSSSYSPTTITGSGSSTLSVSFPATQAAGLTTITTSATDGTHTHTNPLALTISGINTNLIEGWQMNEGTGLTFNDSVASNPMTATGITWGSVPGETGSFPQYTYAATGATTYAVAANNTLTNFSGSTPFSVSFWFYGSSAISNNHVTFVSSLNASSGNYTGWEVGTQGSGYNQIAFYLVNNFPSNAIVIYQTTSQFSTGQLNHVVVTYDGSRTAAGATIYLNGSAVSVATETDTLTSSTSNSNPIIVGKRIDGTNGFGGSISYLRIYNAALTSGQVSALYASGPR